MRKFLPLLLIFAACLLFASCTTVATLFDLPQKNEFDFEKISKLKRSDKENVWNGKKYYEYFIRTSARIEREHLIGMIRALHIEGFTIERQSLQNGMILASRGMRSNEWNSVAGIYFKNDDHGGNIYIQCRITQDVMGGWRNDRAKKIAEAIKKNLKDFREAYPVRTAD